MTESTCCRQTKEPIFWALFGAGGSFGAVCAPALILSLLLLYPYYGQGEESGLFYCFVGTGIGRLFLACFVSLTAWCGLHRIVHCMHDLHLYTCRRGLLCYGLALLITVLSLFALFR